ncbi:T9SS type A sorting domain-containing protein [uncultured Algibacter sp.]|uniref:T9SS type A sorting domain-containing protein n=1 Tax=uncultured Algibacter sp. TaxID=298659 RepID=UPI00261D17EE|nr:T9SS type A sorting domain-containing protein [uncultured Algibacter sp.]
MKKITLILILLLAFGFSYGQTTLSEGDIAITGVNSDNPDEFSFVLLADILNGTQINFTDHGWQSAGVFNTPGNGGNNEGVITWSATADLSCGTEIIITDLGSNIYSATTGLASETDAGFALSESGDQLFAYQGSLATPTLIYGMNYGHNFGWSEATNTNTTALPPSLIDGVTAIYPGNNDNYSYNCSVVLYEPNILAAIGDLSNWIGTNAINRPALSTCGGFTCSKCISTTTWNGTWSNGLPNDLTKSVIINTNYNTSAGDITACSLTVDTGATLTIGNGSFAEVEHDVTINGTITVETQGNFVQNDDAGIFTNNGTSRVNKQTAPKADWFFYTYWSSPVTSETIGSVFPDVDGDRRFKFIAANFLDNDGDDLDDNDNAWQAALTGETMAPGVGYAVTESRFFPGGVGTASFEGAFNTGDVSVGISNVPGNAIASWNFIGNPYPSALDFDAFHAANNTVVAGAAYFWSQATPPAESNPGNQQSNFSKNDYAIYTVGSGGTAGSGTPGGSGVIPNQYIPSAQGFFIAGLDNNSVTFTNDMRMADGTSNTQFFKGSKKSKANNIANRLWIDLTTNNGVFSQILVAYVDGATNGNDGLSYDAPKIVNQDYAAILYSSMDSDDKKYVIQGKSTNSINENEIINLGFSSTINTNTEYKISIAQIEGDFLTNNSVFLKDNLLSTLHNLSDSDYVFTSEDGEFNDRFEIVFNASILSTEDIIKDSEALKIIELEGDRVKFTTSNTIKTVTIYDLLGRELYNLKGNSNSETYNLSRLSSSIYIAKVELINGLTITKKAFKK